MKAIIYSFPLTIGKVLFAISYLLLINKLLASSVEHAAIFALIVGSSAWMANLDFGFGYFIKNQIISRSAPDSKIRFLILLAILTVLFACLINYAARNFFVNSILGLPKYGASYIIISTLIILSTYLGLAQKILIANTEYNALSLIGIAPSLLSFVLVTCLDEVSIDSAAYLLYLPQIVLGAFVCAKAASPLNLNKWDISLIDLKSCLSIFSVAIIGIVVLSVDFYWMKKIIGDQYVIVEYTMAYSIFNLLFVIISNSLLVLWPKISQSSNDVNGVNKFANLFGIASISFIIISTLIIYLVGGYFFENFLHDYSSKNSGLLGYIVVGLGISFSSRVYGDIYSVLFQIKSDLRTLRKVATVQLLVLNAAYFIFYKFSITGVFIVLIINIISFNYSSFAIKKAYVSKFSAL